MEEFKNIDIEAICLNPSFGDLKFNITLPILKRMKSEIIELEDLGYKNYLTRNEINHIDNIKTNFNVYIDRIKSFNLSQPNPRETRDQIENQIHAFYEGSFVQQARNPLIYLRQELKNSDTNEKEFQKRILSLKKIEDELRQKMEKIKEDQISVEKGSGIISSKYLSKVFLSCAEESEKRSKFWSKWIVAMAVVLFIVAGLSLYICLFLNIDSIEKRTSFSILSALLVAIVFYILRFSIKQFNISHHNNQSNKHRSSVAETLENFLNAAGGDVMIKDALLKEAAIAMFRPDSTGFLSKDQLDASSPVAEMINNVVSDKK